MYDKDGTLRSYTDQNGLTINYKLDVLGRVLSKTYISAKGEFLAEEVFNYNSFHCLTETDKEGNVTKYDYDKAGRKIRDEFAGRIIEYGYDPLGRLSTICKHNEDNSLYTNYKRDLEDHILEECKTDSSGNLLYKISYSYDADGNKNSITRYIHGQASVDTFAYDSFGRLLKHIDPNSNTTVYTYDENYVNALGQKVIRKITKDPHDITTIETRDSLDRLVKKEVRAQSTTLASEEKIYDPHGNQTHQIDHVFENGQCKDTQVIGYTYTPVHQVMSITTAFESQSPCTTSYTYSPSRRLVSKTLPSSITLSYEYNSFGYLTSLHSSDEKIFQTFEYNKLGDLITATDILRDASVTRCVDSFGNVLEEIFPCGQKIEKTFDDFNRLITLKIDGCGEIAYNYDPLFLRKVSRFPTTASLLYTHQYDEYDLNGNLVSEQLIGNLGKVGYTTDRRGRKVSITSPYLQQECTYDEVGNLLKNRYDCNEFNYAYDSLSQLVSEKSSEQSLAYTYDSLYNRVSKGEKLLQTNELNQLVSFDQQSISYDQNGNQTRKYTQTDVFDLTYDALNQLIEATSDKTKVSYKYDPLGRCLNRVEYRNTAEGWIEEDNEHYIYHNENEIGAFTNNGELKNLRVLGIVRPGNNSSTVAIELDERVYAPLIDLQDNVRGLVNIDSHEAEKYEFSAFGEELQKQSLELSRSPWQFASKRIDPKLNLINFGTRYYDPETGRWMTPDPKGFINNSNLYQYVFNNPFRYQDPDGQFAFVIPLFTIAFDFVLTWTAAEAVVGAVAGATLGWGAYEINKAVDKRNNNALYKNTNVYAPDRKLPRTPDGVPTPDTDASHTQLGMKESEKRKGEKYPQAREFDEHGKPVRDIDFTDHDRPHDHTNPHQHEYEENPTGGTKSRGDAIPLPKWS